MSEIEDLVPTREICQKLKRKGFPQTTVFKWCRLTRASDVQEGAKEYSVSRNAEDYYVPAKKICSAPTAGEMEEWFKRRFSFLKVELMQDKTHEWKRWSTPNKEHWADGDTDASALAALALEALA